jgi:peptidyl-prolyl cis-trans isomerase D
MAKKPKPKIITKKHLARLERERIQNRYIMIASVAIFVIVVGIITYGILDQTVIQAMRPVAKVGSDTITAQQFEVQVRYDRYQLIQRYDTLQQYAAYFGSAVQDSLTQIETQLADPVAFGSSVLDQMVDNLLIRQEAKRRGITVSKVEVDKALQESFNFYPNGTPSPTLTPTVANTPTLSSTQLALVTITPTPTITFTPTVTATATPGPTNTPAVTATPQPTGPTPTEAPTATPTPYTLAGFNSEVKTYIDSIKNLGITENELRKIIENQLYRDKVLQAITADLKPEDTKVWARHILVQDEATAKDIETRLAVGGTFASLAAKFSTDTTNKDNGGDLGWFTKGVMDTVFENAVFALNVGEISQPVQTQFGWHIIQSLGKEVMPLTGSEFETFRQRTFQNWLTENRTTNNKDITKFDIWSQIVPSDPVFTPGTTTGQ